LERQALLRQQREQQQAEEVPQAEEAPQAEEDAEEDPEEVEQHASTGSGEVHQSHQAGAQQRAAAGGDPSGDPDGNDGDDEGDESRAPSPQPPVQGVDAGRGWVVYSYVSDEGDDFFHRHLVRLLRGRYGHARVRVEYHCWWWTHQRYDNFWRTQVHVRVRDLHARADRVKTVHHAITDRETQEAGIADAARQALYVYRHRHYPAIRHQAERWYPRRRSGEAACTIATLAGVADPQLASTVQLVGALSTELTAVLQENHRLRHHLETARFTIEAMEEHYMGRPRSHSPRRQGESPPHRMTFYGNAASRTTIDP